jgi:SAM-dependent methyltransferase
VDAAKVKTQAVREVRKAMDRAVRRPKLRQAAERVVAEINRSLNDPISSGIYGSEYFGADRDSMDRMGLSGYERYDRDTSNSNAAAMMVWRHFDVRKTLDVGCAAGFVVEALRELGLDAWGTDISHYAINRPAQGARGFLQWGNLMDGLPYRDGEFELLTCLETLEHMRPDMIDDVLKELRRITSKYLVCTIPSFGPNESGPDGWFEVKTTDTKTEEYYAKGPDYEGPIPYEDIYRDARGEPIEGHLTLASFGWWTKQFEKAGFVRCGKAELEIHPHLARYGLTKYWNLYVLRTPDAPEPFGDVRTPEQIAHWEDNFKLSGKVALAEDQEAVDKARAEYGLA